MRTDVVDATLSPGMTPCETGGGQRDALHESVLLHGAHRVGGARGVVLAHVAVDVRDRRPVRHAGARGRRSGGEVERMPRPPGREPAGPRGRCGKGRSAHADAFLFETPHDVCAERLVVGRRRRGQDADDDRGAPRMDGSASAHTALRRRRMVLRVTAEADLAAHDEAETRCIGLSRGSDVGDGVRSGTTRTPSDCGFVVRSAGESVRLREHRVCQAESSVRPLARRAERMPRPARVRMRARKPCFLARRRLLGWKVRLLMVTPEVVSPDALLPGTGSGLPYRHKSTD